MKSPRLTLGQLLNSPSQYVIPAFQRLYRWDRPEWEKLWASLEDYARPEKSSRHFMGFLVLAPEPPVPGKNNVYHLIDGQQRLTTLSLLLCVLRTAAFDAGHNELMAEIEEHYLVHRFKKGTDRYRLYPKLRDRENYCRAVDTRGMGAGGRVGEALQFFSNKITSLGDWKDEELQRRLLALITDRLEFVHATLEPGENPYEIFKGLNSTGVPLGPADLIRNFIFMHAPLDEQDALETQDWRQLEDRFTNDGVLDGGAFSAFFRDFLMQEGVYVGKSATFEAFEQRYLDTNLNAVALTRELRQAADWYAIITGRERDPASEVQTALEQLRALESSTTFPLLLLLFARRSAGRLSDSALAEAIRLLSGFIFRRLVCGEGSRSYGELFAGACKVVADDPVDDLRNYLLRRSHPETPRFEEAFVRFNLYGSRYRKAALELLERARGHKEPADLAQAQVEHIMPQTLSAAWKADLGPDAEEIHVVWLHTPGNLTLSGYNPELQNKPFAQKRAAYAHSNIQLTRELTGHHSWGPTEIEARGRMLAQSASELWPGPATRYVPAPKQASLKSVAPNGISDRDQAWLDFWTLFYERLAATPGHSFKIRKPPSKHYINYRIGPRGYWISALGGMRDRWIGVNLYIDSDEPKGDFAALEMEQQDIEAELQIQSAEQLHWDEKSEARACEIILRRPWNLQDPATWDDAVDWMIDRLQRFDEVFQPRLWALKSNGESNGQAEVSPAALARWESRRRYWQALGEHLQETGSSIAAPVPNHFAWRTYPVQVKNVAIWTYISRRKKKIYVGVTFRGKRGEEFYRNLQDIRAQIDAEFGMTTNWYRLRHHYLELIKDDVDPADESAWPEQHDWLHRQLEKVYEVLVPRLEQLGQGE